MELFVWALDSEVKSLHKHNVRLRIIGDTRLKRLVSPMMRKRTLCLCRLFTSLSSAQTNSSINALTENNDGLTLNIAANYGGRWDIIEGVKKLAEQVQEGWRQLLHAELRRQALFGNLVRTQ
jgi:undecaprenyl diphosphate synthase